MFLLKKIIGPMLMPLSFSLGLLVIGLILLWFSRRQRAGKIVVTVGVLLLAISSYSPIPNATMRPLEYKYPLPLGSDHANSLIT